MRSSLLFTLMLLLSLGLRAQDSDSTVSLAQDESGTPNAYGDGGTTHALVAPKELETTRRYETENLSIVRFDEKKWKEIVGDEKFQETPAKSRGISPRFSAPWAGPLVRIVSYLVIIVVIVLVVYFVVRNISLDLKIKRDQIRTDDLEQPVEDIENIDISGLLEQARREGNFRMAVRLYYLGLLKKLHEMEKIVWKKDKTNRDYLGELFSKEFYFPEMRRLTLSYEAVWYGEHDLNSESFQRLSSQFESVFHELNSQQTP